MPIPLKCPLCKASNYNQKVVTQHVFGDKKKRSAFYHCNSCDVRYQHPPLTKEEEAKFYSSEFESYMDSRSGKEGGWLGPEKHISANKSTVTRRMKYLKPYISPNSDILEVGCSSGFMLFPFSNEGHNCIGIEPSGIFSEYVRSKNILVFDSIEEMMIKNPTKKFDIIKHFFVFEHISEPFNWS